MSKIRVRRTPLSGIGDVALAAPVTNTVTYTVNGCRGARRVSLALRVISGLTFTFCTTTNGSATVTTSNDIRPNGGRVGVALTGTGVQAGSRIISVADDGLSFVMSLTANASGTVTITGGTTPVALTPAVSIGDNSAVEKPVPAFQTITNFHDVTVAGWTAAQTPAANSHMVCTVYPNVPSGTFVLDSVRFVVTFTGTQNFETSAFKIFEGAEFDNSVDMITA